MGQEGGHQDTTGLNRKGIGGLSLGSVVPWLFNSLDSENSKDCAAKEPVKSSALVSNYSPSNDASSK